MSVRLLLREANMTHVSAPVDRERDMSTPALTRQKARCTPLPARSYFPLTPALLPLLPPHAAACPPAAFARTTR